MGTLYRKFCSACDADSEAKLTFDGFDGAVIDRTQPGGEIVSGGCLAYLAHTGELVHLPHPNEFRRLEKAGGTWKDAVANGRLIYIRNLVCSDCGAKNTTASLHTGGKGCGTGLALAALVIAGNVFLFDFHPIVEVLLVYITAFAPMMIIDQYFRIRHRDNVIPYQSDRCIECGGKRLIAVSSAGRRRLPCPRCKQKTMKIRIAGRS